MPPFNVNILNPWGGGGGGGGGGRGGGGEGIPEHDGYDT